ADSIRSIKLRQSLRDRRSGRQPTERSFRAFLFHNDPGTRLLAVLVLEPPIRIGHYRRSVGILHRVSPRLGWTLRVAVLSIRVRGYPEHCSQNEGCSDSSNLDFVHCALLPPGFRPQVEHSVDSRNCADDTIRFTSE